MDGNVDVPCWEGAVESAKLGFDLVEGKKVSKEIRSIKGTVINSGNAEEVVEEAEHLWGVDYAEEE
jgi:hypothetical protein